MRCTWFDSSGTIKLTDSEAPPARWEKSSDSHWFLVFERCEIVPATVSVQSEHSRRPGSKSRPGHLWVKCGGCFMRRWEITADDSVDWRIPNLHASVLHPEVGSFSHADKKPRLHHTWGRHRETLSDHRVSYCWHHHHHHHCSASPGIILMAVLTSFQFWAVSNFQSRMKLLLSVTTGPWEQNRNNSDLRQTLRPSSTS